MNLEPKLITLRAATKNKNNRLMNSMQFRLHAVFKGETAVNKEQMAEALLKAKRTLSLAEVCQRTALNHEKARQLLID